jgi:hypothetical protein
MTDPIVEEVRAIRAKIAEECGYDLKKILEHAHETTKQIPGLKYVTKEELKQRRALAVEDLSKKAQP